MQGNKRRHTRLLKRIHSIVLSLPLLFLMAQPTLGVTIDFDGLSDLDAVTNQFAAQGVLFTNATAIKAGFSLNEVDFPPHSGDTAVSDDGGAMILTFSSPSANVSGFFTYTSALTLTAYDGPNATGNVLGTATSVFSENFVSSAHNSPNEFWMIAVSGIRSLTIVGDPSGGSFVLDDFASSPVPEPSSLLLLGSGVAGLLGIRFCRGYTGLHTHPSHHRRLL